MDESTARAYIIEELRGRQKPDVFGYSSYGYDLYIPAVIYNRLRRGSHDVSQLDAERVIAREAPTYMSAAWRLCLENVLRPGVKTHGQQATDHGSAGMGYSLTEQGKEWLRSGGA